MASARRASAPKRGRPPHNLVRFGISIPHDLLERFDGGLAATPNGNRSEAIRELIREHLTRQDWGGGKGELTATLSLVVESGALETQRRIMEARRELGKFLVSSLQVHLNEREELQVLVLRGPSEQLRPYVERLSGSKGILSCKLVATSSSAQA